MALSGYIPRFIGRFFSRSYFTNLFLGQKGPVWIDVEQPYKVYTHIPQLKSVIDRKSLMYSNMMIHQQDIKSGELEDMDKERKQLLENPNCTQGQNQWLRQMKQQEQIYGNHFLLKKMPSKLMKAPSALWNISPYYMQPVLTGKIFDQTEMSGIVSRYEYINTLTKQTDPFEPEDILWSRIQDLNNPIMGTSPICSLKYPLSNIDAAYKYRNVIMTQKGAIGMISNESKDAAGALPLRDDEREKIEKMYINKYGISEEQSRVILTGASLKWTPMSYPTKELMLFEEIDANMITLVDAFGLNANIFSSKEVKYENVRASIVQCYQDTIIPEADQWMQSLSKFIGMPEGKRLYASYDHLSILKDHKLTGMQAVESIVRSLTQAVQGGLISGPQAEMILASELGVVKDDGSMQQTKTLNKLNRLSPLVANNVLDRMTDNEIRTLVDLPTVEGGDEMPDRNPQQGQFTGAA